ncbi:MAG: outer membrane beta-barrel protein [Chitinophagaceae bacterium]|nr:outer membrane beta-barrel protein [Chitinophagaceae bacterium]
MKQKLHSFVWKSCAAMLVLLSTCLTSNSQYSERTSFFEAGITAGPSNFLGDLGGNYGKGTTFLKDNNIQTTKFMFGAYVTYHTSDWLGFRLAANIGSIEGDDAVIKGKGGLEEARRVRNSNFKSKIQEVFVAAEIYPTVFLEYEPGDTYHKIRPYGVIGVGAFHFNPQGKDLQTNQWVNLKPLHTEGQGFNEFPDRAEYKLTQINIPMGVGVKYFASETLSLSLEVIHRKTFTDYIDDVSTEYIDPALFYNYLTPSQAAIAQRMANKTDPSGIGSISGYGPGKKRGTPTNNDSYFSIGFKLGFRLSSDNRWNNSTRCPVRF